MMDFTLPSRLLRPLTGLILATATVAVPTPTCAQNILGYPSSHRLVTLTGDQLRSAQPMNGIVVVQGPRGPELSLAPGATSGRAEFRVKVPGNTREIIPSWSGRTPGESGFRVLMNLPQAGGWFEAGSWGRVGTEPATRKLAWPDGSYYMYDYAVLTTAVSEVGLAVEMVRPTAQSPSPTVWLVALSCSGATKPARPLLVGPRHGAVTGQPVDSQAPFIPQVTVGRSDWVERTCSPAVISMMLARNGVRKTVLELASETYDKPSDAFGVWNRAVMSAAEHGFDGYMTRLRSWKEVHDALAGGALVGASIRMKAGEVKDPLNRFGRRMDGTKGHIILIRGIKADGSVVTNDPASKDYGNALTWNPADLGKAWFEKGGVAYILKR